MQSKFRNKVISKLIEQGLIKKAHHVGSSDIEVALKIPYQAYLLLINENITREDGDLFFQLCESAIKYTTGGINELVFEGIITREDGDLYLKAIDIMCDSSIEGVYYLLKDKYILKSDGKIYDKAVKKIAERMNDDFWLKEIYKLIESKTITKENGEDYYILLDRLLRHEEYIIKLLANNIITEADGEPYYRVLDKGISDSETLRKMVGADVVPKEYLIKHIEETNIGNPGYAYSLLGSHIITKAEKNAFLKLVNVIINQEKDVWNDRYPYLLLKNKIITKEDGELFNKTLAKAMEDSDYIDLLKNKIITKEDGEIYNQVVNKVLE